MRRSLQGYTLVEIMLVVMIIGLLTALAIPTFIKARTRSHNTRFVNDLRLASDAFALYAMSKGTYPPDSTPAVVPVGMTACLPKMKWNEATAIGGLWDWDYRQFGCTAGVSVYQPARSAAEMRAVDTMIDDGNLVTGSFRSRDQGYIYVIER
jgi:prepilin-type N-terminal cleavage/methylation domain-containing protein